MNKSMKATLLLLTLLGLVIIIGLNPSITLATDGSGITPKTNTPPIDPSGSGLQSENPISLGPPVAPSPGSIISPGGGNPMPSAPGLSTNFAGLTLADSGFIPPDPIAAAGPSQVVSVINVSIQWRDKDGTNTTSQTLANFFTSLSPANATFDPKVIYDQHAGRFVVVTLERVDASPNANPSASNTSRILVAVSDDSNPNGTWYFQAINSKINTGGLDYWSDYPGFAIDEEAMYITNNMFTFPPSSGYLGSRLWILDKFNGTGGGLYGGGTSTVNIYDPATTSGAFTDFTLQPAHIFGTPSGDIGTWLTLYNALTAGGSGGFEYIQVIRINDPLGASGGPTFTAEIVSLGDIEDVGGVFGFPALPDAPQVGSATDIEVNDRRVLHSVWRNNNLWLTMTINPNSGTDTGQTTAHWVQLNTSAVPGAITLADQGNIGGEDIATGAYTFFPSIAVDACDNMAVGFALSASTINAGAYYANRYASDAASTIQSTGTLFSGQGGYALIDSQGRNRWGDYTGTALDPATEASFWIFNEYAGSSNNWLTRYGSFASGIDFGDLPSAYANTNYANNGARHCIGNVFFGSSQPDPDTDGQESGTAAGDGTDEDGVTRDVTDVWSNGASVNIDFDLTGATGTVDIGLWIDWNGNNTFDSGTDFFSFTGVSAGGVSQQTISVPGSGTYTVGDTVNARARVFASGGAPGGSLDATDFTGLATNGEVEDYQWNFTPTAVTLADIQSTASTPVVGGVSVLALFLFTAIILRRRRA